MKQVIILHGWSDTSKSFEDLAKFLSTHEYQALPIWLGDYISLDDDIAVKDVAKRMQEVINEKIKSKELNSTFDMIVHSTGGLVVREWLSSYYRTNENICPLKKLIMLAPANFGSKLASMGQTMLGRLIKGWNNWFHTGVRMLNDLELSSPYQWSLVERDLFLSSDQNHSIYGDNRVWPYVIIGTKPYGSTLRSILDEDGADGTVRVAAANMNVLGVELNFSKNENTPSINIWNNAIAEWEVPFAVLPDYDHSTIVNPAIVNDKVGNMVIEALMCDNWQQYRTLAVDWKELSEKTALLSSDKDTKNRNAYHQFMQVNVHVVDDHGEDVNDYFLEFSGPTELKSDEPMEYFHKDVLHHVHTNKQNPSYRCLYVDRTDLYDNFYKKIPEGYDKGLWMSISATPVGRNIFYFKDYKIGAAGHVLAHHYDSSNLDFKFRRNTTHFVKIIIPRVPSDDVFQLRKAQK